jgi:hypothetical protein
MGVEPLLPAGRVAATPGARGNGRLARTSGGCRGPGKRPGQRRAPVALGRAVRVRSSPLGTARVTAGTRPRWSNTSNPWTSRAPHREICARPSMANRNRHHSPGCTPSPLTGSLYAADPCDGNIRFRQVGGPERTSLERACGVRSRRGWIRQMARPAFRRGKPIPARAAWPGHTRVVQRARMGA